MIATAESVILQITMEPASPQGSGAPLRTFALRKALQRNVVVKAVSVSEMLVTPPQRTSAHITLALPQSLIAQVLEIARDLKPSAVVLEGILLAELADALIKAGYAVIIDAHNVESRLQRDTDIARRGRLWARLRYSRRWARARRAEQDIVTRSQAIWVCSVEDKRRFQQLAPDAPEPVIVPNPVPDWCCEGEMPDLCEGVRALYVGHLAYRPNVRAALRLASGILPRLRSFEPEASLVLAGRTPTAKLTAAVRNVAGLTLRPDPVTLAPLYHEANMALVPLTEGGGTRIKILEAMAFGLPVVASAVAVEGLELVPGQHYLQAETDDEFVAKALILARDAALRRHLQVTAREYAMGQFGPDAIAAAVARGLKPFM